jgi:hypothetical protein
MLTELMADGGNWNAWACGISCLSRMKKRKSLAMKAVGSPSRFWSVDPRLALEEYWQYSDSRRPQYKPTINQSAVTARQPCG